MTASCWASFWPKYATSGRRRLNSLRTTVATPSKWPGRCAPSKRLPRSPTETVVEKPSGYIVLDGRGEDAVDALLGGDRAGRDPRRAGSGRDPRPGPNWVGFTKRLMTTSSHSARARPEERAVPGVEGAHRGDEAGGHRRSRTASADAGIDERQRGPAERAVERRQLGADRLEMRRDRLGVAAVDRAGRVPARDVDRAVLERGEHAQSAARARDRSARAGRPRYA